jgi:hypothetical protein
MREPLTDVSYLIGKAIEKKDEALDEAIQGLMEQEEKVMQASTQEGTPTETLPTVPSGTPWTGSPGGLR